VHPRARRPAYHPRIGADRADRAASTGGASPAATGLFSPEQHEPLAGAGWDEGRVAAAVEAIAADALSAQQGDGFWPVHPDDEDEKGTCCRTGLYLGAAGLVWALHRLGHDLTGTAERLHDRYLQEPDWPGVVPGFLMGEAGILLAAHGLAPRAASTAALERAVVSNAGNETNELMWGAPGTMLVAQSMLAATGERRWADAWRESADVLWSRWLPADEHGCHLWTQRLYRQVTQYVGPGHGFAGAVLALSLDGGLLGAERRAELERRAVATATALAVREGDLANWPPIAGRPLAHRGIVRTQWCHGAPGMVASLAGLAVDDEAFGDLLAAGGELIWRAGPLTKGAGLCHGTAGNGCAFLALHRRLGDELWLDRARRFAMHALRQVEAARGRHGRGRYSLWTGDVGAALYAVQCLDGRDGVPSLQPR
jgi:Lanthionine synthetase C-like protein